MTLTTDEIALMRVDLEAVALPDTCNILSLARTSDGQGGWTEAWGTAVGGTAVACRMDTAGGRKTTVAEALNAYSSWVLTLPHDAGLTTLHRVEHGGYTYSVQSVSDDPSWPICQRAALERA